MIRHQNYSSCHGRQGTRPMIATRCCTAGMGLQAVLIKSIEWRHISAVASPITGIATFVQQRVHANSKENITGLTWGESTSHWWISLTKSQWWAKCKYIFNFISKPFSASGLKDALQEWLWLCFLCNQILIFHEMYFKCIYRQRLNYTGVCVICIRHKRWVWMCDVSCIS